MIEQQEQGVGEQGGNVFTCAGADLLPDFMTYLQAKQAEDREYLVLAQLLHMCRATIEHANAIWHAGRYRREDSMEVTCAAVHYGFQRLVPLILTNIAGGWQELFSYLDQPETTPWSDPPADC